MLRWTRMVTNQGINNIIDITMQSIYQVLIFCWYGIPKVVFKAEGCGLKFHAYTIPAGYNFEHGCLHVHVYPCFFPDSSFEKQSGQ